jgi:hypothetical protein
MNESGAKGRTHSLNLQVCRGTNKRQRWCREHHAPHSHDARRHRRNRRSCCVLAYGETYSVARMGRAGSRVVFIMPTAERALPNGAKLDRSVRISMLQVSAEDAPMPKQLWCGCERRVVGRRALRQVRQENTFLARPAHLRSNRGAVSRLQLVRIPALGRHAVRRKLTGSPSSCDVRRVPSTSGGRSTAPQRCTRQR